MKKSTHSRFNADKIIAASIIHAIGPQKFFKNFKKMCSFTSSISLYPSARIFKAASSLDKPCVPGIVLILEILFLNFISSSFEISIS